MEYRFLFTDTRCCHMFFQTDIVSFLVRIVVWLRRSEGRSVLPGLKKKKELSTKKWSLNGVDGVACGKAVELRSAQSC